MHKQLFDKNNRLISEFASDGNGNNASGYYNYDARGNQISAITNQFTPNSQGDPVVSLSGVLESKVVLNQFDALNRLTTADITQGGVSTVATYLYDGNNLRQSKTVDGITTQHLWNGSNIVADVTGNETQTYIRGLNLTYMKDSSGTLSKYITDGHGDVIALYGLNGVKTQDYRYDAFGNPRAEVVDNNPFRYCGEYTDAESGFVYLRNRYYDPSVGRFVTKDPHWNVGNMIYGDDGLPSLINIMQSGNLYVYGLNNPLRYFDPRGKAVTEWDKQNLTQSELSRLQEITDDWDNVNLQGQLLYRAEAAAMRSKYMMSYESLSPDGSVYIDPYKMFIFNAKAAEINQENFMPYFIAGAAAAAMDGPLPIGDVVGIGIVVVGGIAFLIDLADGKSKPKDLESGMSSSQKGKFQREIEMWKKFNGMRPNDNVPWEILYLLAEEVKQMYK